MRIQNHTALSPVVSAAWFAAALGSYATGGHGMPCPYMGEIESVRHDYEFDLARTLRRSWDGGLSWTR